MKTYEGIIKNKVFKKINNGGITMKKLVIDLGHGGYDPGAVGKGGTKESDVVLKIGKYLESMLKEVDLDVRFTRMSDKYVSLGDRVEFANNLGADYFLSIHVNSASDNTVRGVEVWQYNNDDKHLNEFCSSLCNEISGIFNIRNRGVKLSKGLYVLKNTSMKAALLEVDFISNNEDNLKSIARVIKDNLLKLYNIEDNKRLYKVCVGCYKERSNAINILNVAKSKGFGDAYII